MGRELEPPLLPTHEYGDELNHDATIPRNITTRLAVIDKLDR
jgi:hypothetical protein